METGSATPVPLIPPLPIQPLPRTVSNSIVLFVGVVAGVFAGPMFDAALGVEEPFVMAVNRLGAFGTVSPAMSGKDLFAARAAFRG